MERNLASLNHKYLNSKVFNFLVDAILASMVKFDLTAHDVQDAICLASRMVDSIKERELLRDMEDYF